MNYEAKVSDLSGTSSVLIEDVDSPGRSRRRGLLIAAAVLIALLIGGALLFFSQSAESPFPADDGQQIPTVTVVSPPLRITHGFANGWPRRRTARAAGSERAAADREHALDQFFVD